MDDRDATQKSEKMRRMEVLEIPSSSEARVVDFVGLSVKAACTTIVFSGVQVIVGRPDLGNSSTEPVSSNLSTILETVSLLVTLSNCSLKRRHVSDLFEVS